MKRSKYSQETASITHETSAPPTGYFLPRLNFGVRSVNLLGQHSRTTGRGASGIDFEGHIIRTDAGICHLHDFELLPLAAGRDLLHRRFFALNIPVNRLEEAVVDCAVEAKDVARRIYRNHCELLPTHERFELAGIGIATTFYIAVRGHPEEAVVGYAVERQLPLASIHHGELLIGPPMREVMTMLSRHCHGGVWTHGDEAVEAHAVQCHDGAGTK